MTQKTILGFGRKRFIFVAASIPVLLASGLLTGQPWYEILLALFSVITLMYLAEGKRVGVACGIFFTLGHGALFFSRGVWGLAAFNALFAAPIYVFSLIAWGRHQNDTSHTVQVKQLSWKHRALILGVIAALFAGFFLLLRAINSNNALLDAATLSLFAPAIILLRGRYIENWVLHLAGNLTATAIWVVAATQDILNFNFVLIGAVATVVNVIGLMSWVRLRKETD